MIPTPLNPQKPRQTEAQIGVDPGTFQWVDQLNEEMLQTVQAFQRLHAALQNRMLGK